MSKLLKEAVRRFVVMLISLMMLMVTAVVVLSILGVLLEPPLPTVEEDSVLVIDMTFSLTDQPEEVSPSLLFSELLSGGAPARLSLKALLDTIEAAADDEHIEAIFLHGNILRVDGGSSYASLRELRRALMEFSATGKPVIAYLDYLSQRDYYVASVADRLIMHPFGVMQFNGYAAERIYFGDAFERYGIGVQTASQGAYKSAADSFTRSDLSAEDREQLQDLLEAMWSVYLDDIAQARDMPTDRLQTIASDLAVLNAEDALENGLVDELAYKHSIIDELKSTYSATEEGETFEQISLGAYMSLLEYEYDSDNVVAVIYAEGAIVEGEGFGMGITGDGFSRRLRELQRDDDIKAVVLRVNSSGGSASASEKILEEVRRLNDKVPVVVSMGGVAASGGYWIGAESDHIMAEPNTVTGSIGVVAMTIHYNQLANNYGITFDGVKTADKADMLLPSRPKTEAEMERLRHLTGTIYEDFIELVSRGRDMTLQQVEAIAQGRVWSGQSALELGLVDELGGLQSAIEKAAELANLGADYIVEEHPRYKSLEESLTEFFEDGWGRGYARQTPMDVAMEDLQKQWAELQSLNDPNGIYLRMPFFLQLP